MTQFTTHINLLAPAPAPPVLLHPSCQLDERKLSAMSNSKSNSNPGTLDECSSVRSKFWSIMQDGLSKLMSDAKGAWSGPDSQDYALEKTLIKECYRPFMWGMASTCLCFVTFRVTGTTWFRQLRQSVMPTSTRTTSISTKPPPVPEVKQWKSYSERVMEEQRDKLNDAFSLPTDLLLSVMIGLSVTGITTRPSVLKRDFENAPLLPGKSLVSKYLCTDMTKLYNRVDPSLWEKEDGTLEALRNFALNCGKRDQLEQEIRREQSLPDGYVVSIPNPGIRASNSR